MPPRQDRERELAQRLERSERTVRALRDVGIALAGIQTLDQLLELILRKLTEVVDADRATLFLLDPESEHWVSRSPVHGGEHIVVPVGVGIVGAVGTTGRPIRVADAYTDPRFSPLSDQKTGYRTRSILAVPMRSPDEKIVGVLQVLNKKSEDPIADFSLQDEDVLMTIAAQAAIAIDHARMVEDLLNKNRQLAVAQRSLERRVSDLRMLFRLESALARAQTIEDVARAAVVESARACAARAGALLVDEDEGGCFMYFVDLQRAPAPFPTGHESIPSQWVDPPPALHRLPVRRGEGIAGRSMVEDLVLRFPEAKAKGDVPISARVENVVGRPVGSAMATPLHDDADQPIGALALYNSDQGSFSEDDRELLQHISANIGTSLVLFRARTEAERSHRLSTLGQLLSSIIHDMRTPLTVVSAHAQLMAREASVEERAEHATVIQRQFDALMAMQNELLAFARGERTVLIRKVILDRFFAQCEAQTRTQVAGTNIEVHMDIRAKGHGRFDEHRLGRALFNLTQNAIDAMATTGGQLTVGATFEGNALVISVKDTGPGLPAPVKKRLFQPFTTSGKVGGTGLGLSNVKRIVEEHGGSVEVKSTQRGTTFTMRLPQ